MRWRGLLIGPLALLMVTSCDQVPTDSVLVGDEMSMNKWKRSVVDEDSWGRRLEQYLDCLDETVVIEGEINFIWYGSYDEQVYEFWWTPELTTMVGPSGTWSIQSQDGRGRWSSSGKQEKQSWTHRVTWINDATAQQVRYRHSVVWDKKGRDEVVRCNLTGKAGN